MKRGNDIFKKLFSRKEDEALEAMKMNCVAMNQVMADMIDEVAHTSVYDENYEVRLKALNCFTDNSVKLKAQIQEVEHPRNKWALDWVGIIRAATEIAKTYMIITASYNQVMSLYQMETNGVIMSRNLNKIQLPRP